VNLLGEANVDVIKQAVWSCIQEEPTKFGKCTLYDIGAYPEPPICKKLTWKMSEPWAVRTEDEDRKLKEIVEKAKAASLKKEGLEK